MSSVSQQPHCLKDADTVTCDHRVFRVTNEPTCSCLVCTSLTHPHHHPHLVRNRHSTRTHDYTLLFCAFLPPQHHTIPDSITSPCSVSLLPDPHFPPTGLHLSHLQYTHTSISFCCISLSLTSTTKFYIHPTLHSQHPPLIYIFSLPPSSHLPHP